MTDKPAPAPNGSERTSGPGKDKTRLISLGEASEMYGFSHVHLRQMAREGRLSAEKIGRYWITTPADVEVYIASRKPTGRFRKDIRLDT